jgi:transcription termination factor NusA
LRTRAKDALLTEMLAVEEDLDDHAPTPELLALEGMDEETAYALAARKIFTVDDLADQAVDDLIDIEGMDEERAGALIMAARAPMLARLEAGEGGDAEGVAGSRRGKAVGRACTLPGSAFGPAQWCLKGFTTVPVRCVGATDA